jgi:hypothetical protein
MPRTEHNAPISFRLGTGLLEQVEAYATPRSIPVHRMLRILVQAGLRAAENGPIDLKDPLKAA